MSETGADALSALPVWAQITLSIGTLIAATLAGLYGVLKKRSNGDSTDIAELMRRLVESNEQILKIMRDETNETNMRRMLAQTLRELRDRERGGHLRSYPDDEREDSNPYLQGDGGR